MVKAMKAARAVPVMQRPKGRKGTKKGSDERAGPLTKGQMLKRPAGSGRPKGSVGQGTLSKQALDKSGGKAMTLQEKIKMAADMESPEEGAQWLKEHMTKLEHSKVWNRHQRHLGQDKEAKEEYDKSQKREKGLASALWVLRTGVRNREPLSKGR